ncbi:hypothetical protein E8E13_003976 [Curvularia kusanoi]|uniref:Uncharacterized protein n=1 Tax=Curvularia kusanoi TaxID=90978 RepID=A0A9P4W6Y1_CURKU|nr:hypothetical protein E8E13_003976 [Curvularia kusanoi]
MRQLYLLQSLNIVIEDILDVRQKPENSRKPPKGPSDIVEVLDTKSSLDDHVDLLNTEPIVLAHDVNFWFFSRPELIPDERGRALPARTDRHISATVFDAVHFGVKTVAVWDYTFRLVNLLHESPRNSTRVLVLYELSTVCRMEYSRAQATFRRAVSVGLGGSRWIQRMSTTKKDGSVRTSVKQNIDVLLRTDPQLYYMLQLCQDRTTHTQAALWIQKLEDLHRAHPLEKDKLAQHELDTLSDLAVAVTFIQSLSSLVKLPSMGQKRQGQGFGAECSLLADRISQLRAGIDLGDFAIPIDNLLQPGRAASALTKLSEYFIEKLGADINSLYKDLVKPHVAKMQQQQIRDSQTDYVTPYIPISPETSTEQKKDKRKTATGPPIEVPSLESTDTVGTSSEHLVAKPDAFEVKYDTFAVFSLLLSRPSATRGSISWHAFTSAMADLGFSIIPKFGSIYTFVPPHSVAVQKRLTLHRPRQSNLEQFHLLSYSRRLKTVYGWGSSTFVRL